MTEQTPTAEPVAKPARAPARPKLDPVCAAAVDQAYAVAVAEAGAELVGEHLAALAEADRVVTHLFAASYPGYTGWQWAVTVARAARAKAVTIDEVVLLPGPEAIVAVNWVPWSDRVQPGDLGAGDLYPSQPDDPRLTAGFTDTGASDDDEVGAVVDELGLGRERVLTGYGRDLAAERWYHSEFGPEAQIAEAAAHRCGSCGYYIALQGGLGAAFGACTNEMSPGDGHVVAAGYGCGAHSSVAVAAEQPPPTVPRLDTLGYDELDNWL